MQEEAAHQKVVEKLRKAARLATLEVMRLAEEDKAEGEALVAAEEEPAETGAAKGKAAAEEKVAKRKGQVRSRRSSV